MAHAYNLLKTEEEVREMDVRDLERFYSRRLGLRICKADHYGTIGFGIRCPVCGAQV